MYRIMLVAKEAADVTNNLYKYLTVTNTEGKVVPYETETLEDLDAQVEKMLDGDYKKKDILIVQIKDFTVSSDLYETSDEPESP